MHTYTIINRRIYSILIKQERPEEYKTTEEMTQKAFLNEEYSDKKEHLQQKWVIHPSLC